MFDLNAFISANITCRATSLFEQDIIDNQEILAREIEGKSVCVIGGAGSIGSSFIKAVLRFRPGKLVAIDLNERENEQVIFDTINSTGVKLTASDIIKNALFD